MILEITKREYRILASQLHIGEEILHTVFLHCHDHIGRLAARRICRAISNHGSHYSVRINLFCQRHHLRTGNKLIMYRLIH